jgi:malonate transporter
MEVFETVFPIIAIALAGYGAAKKGLFSSQECDALYKFAFTCLIPSLLFISTARAELPESMAWPLLFSYYVGVVAVYFVAVVVGRVLYGYEATEQSVFGMGAAYSNATIIGIPVCSLALGQESLIPLLIIISVHNVGLYTIGILLAERNTLSLATLGKDFLALLKQLVANPITGSLIAGGVVNLSGLTLYAPLAETFSLLGQAAVPAALFVLGTLLARYKVGGQIGPALVLSGLKLIVLPLSVWLLVFKVTPLDPLWASTALLTSAMPVGVSAYFFSLRYEACEATVATAILVSTVGSVLTLGAVLAYVRTLV